MSDELDPQQDNVYRAQREVFSSIEDKDLPLDALQDMASDIVAQPWFRSRYSHVKKFDVKDGRGSPDAQTSRDGKGALFPKETRRPYILVHEMAHRVDDTGGEDHGAVFCGVFLFMVGRVYELSTKAKLSRRFKKYKVTWDHKIAKYGQP